MSQHMEMEDMKEEKLGGINKISGEIFCRCERTVFYPHLESTFDIGTAGPYYIACKEFYQNINKTGSELLPRKVTRAPWQSIKSVVGLNNPSLRQQFKEERQRLGGQGKVDEHGLVRETLLFHGSENGEWRRFPDCDKELFLQRISTSSWRGTSPWSTSQAEADRRR